MCISQVNHKDLGNRLGRSESGVLVEPLSQDMAASTVKKIREVKV